MTARRHLLLSVIRPSIEYGSEVWEGNKSQAGSLESIILDGAKRILGCSSKTCNEAVRGDTGLDTLQSRRDRAKLKWWYKLATLPEDSVRTEHSYQNILERSNWRASEASEPLSYHVN